MDMNIFPFGGFGKHVTDLLDAIWGEVMSRHRRHNKKWNKGNREKTQNNSQKSYVVKSKSYGKELYMGKTRKRTLYTYTDVYGNDSTVYIAAKTYREGNRTCLVLLDSERHTQVEVLTINTLQDLQWDEILVLCNKQEDTDAVDWLMRIKAIGLVHTDSPASNYPELDLGSKQHYFSLIKCSLDYEFIIQNIRDGSRADVLRKKAKEALGITSDKAPKLEEKDY